MVNAIPCNSGPRDVEERNRDARDRVNIHKADIGEVGTGSALATQNAGRHSTVSIQTGHGPTRTPNHCLRDLPHKRNRAAVHPSDPQQNHGSPQTPGLSVRNCETERHVPVRNRLWKREVL